jgi:hypothetical protein
VRFIPKKINKKNHPATVDPSTYGPRELLLEVPRPRGEQGRDPAGHAGGHELLVHLQDGSPGEHAGEGGVVEAIRADRLDEWRATRSLCAAAAGNGLVAWPAGRRPSSGPTRRCR